MTFSPSPDFLGIGAPRAGTTWLWTVLRQHPQIWMPPRKELHYFDRAEKYPTASHLQHERLLTRLFRLDRSSRKWWRCIPALPRVRKNMPLPGRRNWSK